MLSAGGGCEMAAITRCKCAWGKFRKLLPLTNRQVPLLTRGKVYSSCVRSVMLHAAETWVMKANTLNRLRRNGRAMIRWICNVKAKDEVSSCSPFENLLPTQLSFRKNVQAVRRNPILALNTVSHFSYAPLFQGPHF